MTHRKKITSQSGFMSVEAIATSLFYLIMVAIVAGIAAQVISSGKMAASLNAVSILRVSVQYIGANCNSDYSSVATLNPHEYVSIIKPAQDDDSDYTLPTTHPIRIGTAGVKDVNPDTQTEMTATSTSLFTMEIADLSPSDCRKVAYYGLGAGYGVALADGTGKRATKTFTLGAATGKISDVESDCDGGVKVIHLTSK
ncbi:MAG: hypothetical protein K6G15_03210 [Desulfovibrio sp.]|nr:hypothetical protein [Desulfovibrio sp.]